VSAPFVHRLRVRYVECDMQGHVFAAHYYTWMDIAHTAMWQDTLGPYRDFTARGLDFVVAESGARFRAGAHFDDEVEIAVTLDPLTTSSMTSRHAMRRGGELLTEGWLRHVCVDPVEMAKRPWPEEVRAALATRVAE
jgi:acyl-CoA thioester hydrolase